MESIYDLHGKESVKDSFKQRMGSNAQFDCDKYYNQVKQDMNFRYKIHNKVDLFNSQTSKKKRRTSHDIVEPSNISNNYLANTEFRYIQENEIDENLNKFN